MKGSSPWTMTPTQPLSHSCLTPAPALQPLELRVYCASIMCEGSDTLDEISEI